MTGRRRISLALAATFLALPLASCGQLAAQPPVLPSAANAQSVRPSADVLASRFARAWQTDPDFHATLQGQRVLIQGPDDLRLVYDFTRTPATGKVRLTVGNQTSDLPYVDNAQEVSWTVAKMAVRMVYGGVKAYYKYKKTHTGPDFNREDLVKAVLYGMLSQGLSGLPGGFLWKQLLPIVWQWILNEPPITLTTVKQTYERWAKDLGKIEAILREYQRQQAPQAR